MLSFSSRTVLPVVGLRLHLWLAQSSVIKYRYIRRSKYWYVMLFLFSSLCRWTGKRTLWKVAWNIRVGGREALTGHGLVSAGPAMLIVCHFLAAVAGAARGFPL